MNKPYKLAQSPLYRMRNRRKLAVLLKLEPTYFRTAHNYSYRYFTEPKPNGGERHYSNPLGILKVIQKRIHVLLQRIETPDWLTSGKKGEDYISNGKKHLSADFLLTMDISQFYDSVKRNRVYRLFRNTFCMADDIATIMTNLVMDNDSLPTGAPSSQLIAFWAYREMFDEIADIAVAYGCKFTLYVDDMAFSSDQSISYALRETVSQCLHKYGLQAKRKKDHFYGKNNYKVVTGFGFKNGIASARNSKKKEILSMYRLAEENKDSIDIKSLEGKLNAARQNQPNLFKSFDVKSL